MSNVNGNSKVVSACVYTFHTSSDKDQGVQHNLSDAEGEVLTALEEAATWAENLIQEGKLYRVLPS